MTSHPQFYMDDRQLLLVFLFDHSFPLFPMLFAGVFVPKPVLECLTRLDDFEVVEQLADIEKSPRSLSEAGFKYNYEDRTIRVIGWQ